MKILAPSRLAVLAAGATLSLVAATVTASVSQDRARSAESSAANAAAPQAFGGVDAPGVRLAALFKKGGAPVRTKGVEAVQRIATGVYCIRPDTASGINIDTIVPTLSPEYFYSGLNEVMVQYAAAKSGCGPGRIGVYTLADLDHDGVYTFSNEVGFTIVVP